MSRKRNRRDILRFGGAALAAGVAGCQNDSEPGTVEDDNSNSADGTSGGGGSTEDGGSGGGGDGSESLGAVTVDEEWTSYQADLANTGATSNTGPASGDLAERWYLEVKEGDGVVNQPLVVDGTVYAGDEDGILHAVDASSGEVEWQTDVDTTIRNTPAYADGTLFVPAMAKVYAFDAASGEQEWEYQHNGKVRTAPAVQDGTVYVGNDYPEVVAMDAETGDTEWTHTPSEGGSISASPVIADGRLHIGTHNGQLLGLDVASGEVAWSQVYGDDKYEGFTVADGIIYAANKDGNLYAVDAASGEEQWTLELTDMFLGPPTYRDGAVYTGDETLYAVDAEEGTVTWEGETEIDGAVVAAGEALLVPMDRQVLALDPATGDRLWAFDRGGERTNYLRSAPVTASGLVFVADHEGLVALQEQ